MVNGIELVVSIVTEESDFSLADLIRNKIENQSKSTYKYMQEKFFVLETIYLFD
jgi:hypothetical protein